VQGEVNWRDISCTCFYSLSKELSTWKEWVFIAHRMKNRNSLFQPRRWQTIIGCHQFWWNRERKLQRIKTLGMWTLKTMILRSVPLHETIMFVNVNSGSSDYFHQGSRGCVTTGLEFSSYCASKSKEQEVWYLTCSQYVGHNVKRLFSDVDAF
jgi:hypothetical protein